MATRTVIFEAGHFNQRKGINFFFQRRKMHYFPYGGSIDGREDYFTSPKQVQTWLRKKIHWIPPNLEDMLAHTEAPTMIEADFITLRWRKTFQLFGDKCSFVGRVQMGGGKILLETLQYYVILADYSDSELVDHSDSKLNGEYESVFVRWTGPPLQTHRQDSAPNRLRFTHIKWDNSAAEKIILEPNATEIHWDAYTLTIFDRRTKAIRFSTRVGKKK